MAGTTSRSTILSSEQNYSTLIRISYNHADTALEVFEKNLMDACKMSSKSLSGWRTGKYVWSCKRNSRRALIYKNLIGMCFTVDTISVVHLHSSVR